MNYQYAYFTFPMTVTIGQPTANNRVYTKECFDNYDVRERVASRKLLVFTKSPLSDPAFMDSMGITNPSLTDAVGIVTDINLEKSAVTFAALPSKVEIAEAAMRLNYKLNVRGRGLTQSNGQYDYLTDYQLTCFIIEEIAQVSV